MKLAMTMTKEMTQIMMIGLIVFLLLAVEMVNIYCHCASFFSSKQQSAILLNQLMCWCSLDLIIMGIHINLK